MAGSHVDPNSTECTSVPNVKKHSVFKRNVHESVAVSQKNFSV